MQRSWGVVGIPTSAGARTPGLEKGPAALRDAGIIDAVRLTGSDVHDHGDISTFRWRPDPEHLHAQNVPAAARTAVDTASAVERILARGEMPLVLGGDCTITIGVIAGFANAGRRPALLYIDGGPDLYTPETRTNGNLDATGVAHMLALPGHVAELAAVGPRVPLLTPNQLVSFGALLDDDDPEQLLMAELGITAISAVDVHADVDAASRRARATIEKRASSFVVHIDVDVLAFADTPIADSPDSGGDPFGLTLAELTRSLALFASSSRLAGLVITEVNPDHAPGPEHLQRFAASVTGALAGNRLGPA
jgi:arginase